MRKTLYKYAFISSPILAIYGVSPFYIFDKFNFISYMSGVSGLSINILFVWILNIYLTLNYSHIKNYKKYAISYLLNFIFQLCFAALSRVSMHNPFKEMDQINNYLVYPFITSLAFNAIILLLCNSIVTSYKKSKAEEEVQQLKLQNIEAEKQILLQQLQPHFLFNSLSVLKSLIHERPNEAEDYTVKLSEFLRYSVKAPTQMLVTLEDELKFTLGYIDLQKVRFGNAFSYTIDVPEIAIKMQIPVYALQVLVENIFKHNYFTEKNPMHLEIKYEEKKLSVKNNKSIIKVAEKHLGTGLANLNQRHILITGKEIEVANSKDFFSVKLHLID